MGLTPYLHQLVHLQIMLRLNRTLLSLDVVGNEFSMQGLLQADWNTAHTFTCVTMFVCCHHLHVVT